MSLSDSPRAAARFAAAVLAIGGVVGCLTNHLTLSGTAANDIVAAIDILVGITVWFLPWDRWPARANVSIALAGLVIIGAWRAVGYTPSASFVASFVMVFMWVGVTQPPKTSLWLAAPTAAAYLIPTLVVAGRHSPDLQAIFVVLARADRRG